MRLCIVFSVGILLAGHLYPATSSAVILRIQSEIQAGHIAAAERELIAALQSDPRDGGLYNLRGIIQATRGETAKAAESFSLATELSPGLVNAYLNFGRACEILSQHGDISALNRAIAAFRQLLARAPDAKEAKLQFRANLQHMAAGYQSRAQLVEAQRAWEFLAETDPSAIEPLTNLARIAQQRHDFKSALSYLAHARVLQPGYAPVHFFFGVVCIELNLPVEAKKSLQKAIDLDPNNAMYNYARGSVELQGKSAWLATPYFKKFVAAQPDNPRGHFALGAALFASQDYTAAAEEMKRVAGNRETAAGAQYFLGRIAKVEGDWNAAAAHLAKSIAATPDYSDSHAELGLAKMHTGDLTGARAELDRALQLNRDSYLANANLLTLYQRTKDPRFEVQQRRLRELDSKRSEKQELMLRTIRVEP